MRAMRERGMAALVRARARIASPDRWVQHHFAVDGSGFAVGSRSGAAVRWCALGAVAAETHGARAATVMRARAHLAIAARMAGFGSVAELNDATDHAAVLAMFDEAIRRK